MDETKTEQANKHNEKENQNCEGICSPFLTCGSCVGFTFPNFAISFVPLNTFLKNDSLISAHKEYFTNDFISKIWQPPKIS